MVRFSEQGPTRLITREQIERAAGRSWPTIEKWIKTLDFPAAKIGQVWVSDTTLIDSWYRDRIKRRFTA